MTQGLVPEPAGTRMALVLYRSPPCFLPSVQWHSKRRLATLLYLVSIFGTLASALALHSALLCILFIVLQTCALLWCAACVSWRSWPMRRGECMTAIPAWRLWLWRGVHADGAFQSHCPAVKHKNPPSIQPRYCLSYIPYGHAMVMRFAGRHFDEAGGQW